MTTTPTEQEMAAAREILDIAHDTDGAVNSFVIATIIHKHNEELWNQWVAKWQATVDTLGNANARALEAEQQRDQLADRCAELEKLNQSAELQVTRLISIVAEQRLEMPD